MVCPWIIQSLLNRGNGFKTNVAQYHGRYCYCIVLCNFHKYLSLSSDLPKGVDFNSTIPRSCTSLNKHRGHMQDGIRATLLQIFTSFPGL